MTAKKSTPLTFIKKQVDPFHNDIIWIYGATGTWKSTFASTVETTSKNEGKGEMLIFDFHRGDQTKGIECYNHNVKNWQDFLNQIDLLSKADHPFSWTTIDQVDGAYFMASKHVLKASGRDPSESLSHVTDISYKGTDVLVAETTNAILRLRDMPFMKGVIVLSQDLLPEVTSIYTYNKAKPAVVDKLWNHLNPFCRGLFYATIEPGQEENIHVLKTKAATYWQAKPVRGLTMPDTIPMEWAELRKYLGV